MEKIYAIVNGKTEDAGCISDPVFAQEMIGKTIAIIPNDNKIYSPVDGKVIMTYPSNHAIGIISNNKTELLIHVGLDTVMLKGEHFKRFVEVDQEVKKGDLIMEFDLEKIKEKGYDITIPLIITNTQDFKKIEKNINIDIVAGSTQIMSVE